MTFISNDPSFWPLIDFYQISSYYTVASSAVVVYDWALTFGQEFNLVWRQRWSFVTVIYLCVRYMGLVFSVLQMLTSSTSFSLTDKGCIIDFIVQSWMSVITNAMLGVVIITRLYAMYQRSRRMLIFLVSIFSAVTIACVVLIAIQSRLFEFEEFILSGNHQCYPTGGQQLLTIMTWILTTAWEIVALCLVVWITVKHFRGLPGRTIEDLFPMLLKTHVFYFTFYVAAACLNLGSLSPSIDELSANTAGVMLYNGILQVSFELELFVLGPRLILSIRQYSADVVANSDEEISVPSIAFRERTQMSISGTA